MRMLSRVSNHLSDTTLTREVAREVTRISQSHSIAGNFGSCIVLLHIWDPGIVGGVLVRLCVVGGLRGLGDGGWMMDDG